ncbi:hypothetical protein ABK040_011170 [Willaertia magna]
MGNNPTKDGKKNNKLNGNNNKPSSENLSVPSSPVSTTSGNFSGNDTNSPTLGNNNYIFGVDVEIATQRNNIYFNNLPLKTDNNEINNNQTVFTNSEIEIIKNLKFPLVIYFSLKFLNQPKHLMETGIYRIPGDHKKVFEYRDIFNKGQIIDFWQELNYKENRIFHDAHDVCGLIKQYLRDLPETLLFTNETVNAFTVTYLKTLQNDNIKISHLQQSLQKLPNANRETIRALTEHFTNVVKYSDFNKMNIENLIKCICGTSPFVTAFYLMVQYYDKIFEPTGLFTENNNNNNTDNDNLNNDDVGLDWLKKSDFNQEVMNGHSRTTSAITSGGGRTNLTNEMLDRRAGSVRESRRRSYFQRAKRLAGEEEEGCETNKFGVEEGELKDTSNLTEEEVEALENEKKVNTNVLLNALLKKHDVQSVHSDDEDEDNKELSNQLQESNENNTNNNDQQMNEELVV